MRIATFLLAAIAGLACAVNMLLALIQTGRLSLNDWLLAISIILPLSCYIVYLKLTEKLEVTTEGISSTYFGKTLACRWEDIEDYGISSISGNLVLHGKNGTHILVPGNLAKKQGLESTLAKHNVDLKA